MILYDTPPGLILDNIRGEAEKVGFALRKQERIAKNEFMRLGPDKKIFVADYTVPASKNRYLLYLESVWNFPANIFPEIGHTGVILYTNGPKGHDYWITGRMDAGNETISCLFQFTGHFLSRYRERSKIQVSESPHELAALYITRNFDVMVEQDFKKLNFNAEKYENGEAAQVQDGVVFFTKTTLRSPVGTPFLYFKMNTFVSLSTLKEPQTENVNSYGEMASYMSDEKFQRKWAEHVNSIKTILAKKN